MSRRSRLQGEPRTVIDLTLSDNESFRSEPTNIPVPAVPEPTQPNRARRLTARECLQADRIAYGEIEVPPPPEVFAHVPPSPSLEHTLDLVDEQVLSEVRAPHVEPGPSTKRYVPSAAVRESLGQAHQRDDKSHDSSKRFFDSSNLPKQSYIQEETSIPVVDSVQTGTSTVDLCRSSESGLSSDDDFVLYGDKDIIDLTKLKEEEPEVVEMMAHGQPRRACAPTSFKGLLESGETKVVKRFLQASSMRLTREERAEADKHRADLIQRGVAAHHALWDNRHVHKFRHNCGRIDVGRARGALVHMAQLFGASAVVVKQMESGKYGKCVILEAEKRLCSPAELDIRDFADKLIDRAFKEPDKNKMSANTKMKKTKREKKKKAERRKERAKEKKDIEKEKRKKQQSERMKEVAQAVRKDEAAFDHVQPIQLEIQRGEIKKGEVKQASILDGSVPSSGKRVVKAELRPPKSLQIPRKPISDGNIVRKRTRHVREEKKSDVSPRTSWVRKRQRKLEGTKIESGNKGFAMLEKMGWSEGQRLGARKNGISEPIYAKFRNGRKGLGTKKS